MAVKIVSQLSLNRVTLFSGHQITADEPLERVRNVDMYDILSDKPPDVIGRIEPRAKSYSPHTSQSKVWCPIDVRVGIRRRPRLAGLPSYYERAVSEAADPA